MFMEYSKDFGHPGSRLTIIRKDSSQLATVLQDVIFIPYGQKKLIFDFDEEKFQTKLTIDIEEGSFNLVHVRENEVHYKMPQKHTDLCVLKFGKKRIEQEAQEETYSLPIASVYVGFFLHISMKVQKRLTCLYKCRVQLPFHQAESESVLLASQHNDSQGITRGAVKIFEGYRYC
uniref:Uncharacterized protein n=1 Tax=Parascaris univalens TaxID=6257 RepID=A0A915A0U1_PARUN